MLQKATLLLMVACMSAAAFAANAAESFSSARHADDETKEGNARPPPRRTQMTGVFDPNADSGTATAPPTSVNSSSCNNILVDIADPLLQKLSTDLVQLYRCYEIYGDAMTQDQTSITLLPPNLRVQVDLTKVFEDTMDDLVTQATTFADFQVSATFGPMASGNLPVAKLEALAQQCDALLFARSVGATTVGVGPGTTTAGPTSEPTTAEPTPEPTGPEPTGGTTQKAVKSYWTPTPVTWPSP